MHLGGRPLQ
ncbi:unnamed protein product, partial [Rotaria sp. Silwood2]